MAEPLPAPVPITDPGDPDLQTRLADLRLALRDWQKNRQYSQPTQKRLEQLTLQCAQLVESWQQMQRRRATDVPAIGKDREGRAAIESHIQEATGERIRSLERAIEQEWEGLPAGPDDQSRQLSEQAVSLVESCVTATNLALRGFANAESRVATLEREIQTGMAKLSSDLQLVLTELRGSRPQGLPGASPAFPLEGVMRIHQELRESDAGAGSNPEALKGGPARALPGTSESATALAARVESLERAVEHAAEAAPPRGGWRPWYAVIALVVILGAVAALGLWLQRRVDARLNEAALRVSEAERQRDATVAATRQEAGRQVADARQTAARAQIVGNVLAAPDLVRYWLTGVGDDPRAYAHVLFSRSRGMVFSASRLAPAGEGQTYQLWLLTRSGPVSGGLMTPDAEGRITLATDIPPALAGRLTGALLTREATGGGSVPSTNRILIPVE